MNDEQFEHVLKFIQDNWHSGQELAGKMRARDTAQREALARVEAERDKVSAVLARVENERKNLQEQGGKLAVRWALAVNERKAAQAQLAEAVGLLREVEPARYFADDLDARVEAFLARHAQAEQQEAPIPEYFQEACDKLDWTPEEALRFYAEGKHFDTDRGRTRILDTGAIASNALKHASLAYLEMKGDAELSELRAALATQPAAGEPIQVEAVAVTRARKNGGLALEWLIEGGISALEAPGVVLLVAHGTVIDDQGSGEVYLAPPAAAHGDEYEIWSAAQLSPGEGIEDGAERIRALIEKPAAHGDDTRRIDWMACTWRLGGKLPDVDHGSFREVIDAAMRAQGDGEVQ